MTIQERVQHYADRHNLMQEDVAFFTLMAEGAVADAVAAEREACAKVAEAQELYYDTHTGTRQIWVKEQIAAAIRARATEVINCPR
jgi:hypothetical protein